MIIYQMKKNFLYVLACLVLMAGLASCSDDDATENPLPLAVTITNGDKQDLVLGNSLTLEAKVENGENALCEWILNEEKVSAEMQYVFTPENAGTYNLKFRAYRDKDEDSADVSVNVYVAYTSVKSMNDILFWAGEGENRSALAIQWISGDDWENPVRDNVHLLCWGYRWNAADQPTGNRMILDLAKADPRLFVVMGGGFGGIESQSVRGFGYDANGDGLFSITNASTSVTYSAADFEDGVIVLSGDDTGDGYTSADAADYWEGGWYEGYCSYYLGDDGESVPESFDYSPYMAGLRQLTPNSWDAWTYSSINGGMVNTFPFGEWMVSAIANHP